MFKQILNLFSPRRPLICGGEGLLEVSVGGKVCGTIRYRRPTSDEKLDYLYQLQSGLGTELQLKEIKDAKNKNKKCHEIAIRDLSIPFAEKVFCSAEGFIDGDSNKVDALDTGKQFKLIKDYWSHALVDLVAIAYSTEGTVKKKF